MKKTQHIIISIILLIAVTSISFYFGMNYGKSQSARPAFNAANFQGMRTNRTGTNGSNFISGDIISKDGTSMTIKLPGSAGSKIIFYSDTTPISKMAPGTAGDLANGTSVSVAGTVNSDGSVTAQSIQIRPNIPKAGPIQ